MADNKELISLIKRNIDKTGNLEKLYNQNKGFIYTIIVKRVHGIYEIEDLLQIAYIALVKAVEYYDDTLEQTSFLQILKYCIWNEMRDSTSDLPGHMQAKICNYKKIYRQLCDDLGRTPKTFELMLKLNISMKELEIIRTAMQVPLSFDEPLNGEKDTATRLDLYAESEAEESNPFDEFLDKEVNKGLGIILREEIDKLPEKSKGVLYKRIIECKTLEKVGREYNVKYERIRQIENEALRKIRSNKKFMKKLYDYIGLNELNKYKKVGAKQFNTTWTSSTEWLVLKRENIREQLNRKGL